MKKIYQLPTILKLTLSIALLTFGLNTFAQCPTITCPANITVNNDPGQCSAVVNYVAPVGTDPCGSASSVTFNCTGGNQTWTVPAGVTTICVDVKGAQGNRNTNNRNLGGLGGQVTGNLAVTPGQVLQINVGCGGTASRIGGWNGGGNGGSQPGCVSSQGGGGGGASDIRVPPYGLANRVAVGGGGGGTGGDRRQGCSPGTGGGGGGGYYGGGGGGAYGGRPGFGGTQVAGGAGGTSCCGCPLAPQPGAAGALGNGGNGGGLTGTNNQAANNPGCAGGDGGAATGGQGPNCTGGTGCPSTWAGASGGGGSNFVGGLTATTSVRGVQSGDGEIIISCIPSAGPVTTTQIAGLPSGATYPVGVTTNTFVVSNGTQTDTCSFTVTVVDNENPTITCPANITVNNDPGQCDAVVNYTAPVGVDNCPGAVTTLTAGLASGSTFPIGTTTVTYTVTDASNNTATCSFTVTVVDNENPTITCPANVTSCNPVVNGIAPIAFNDNCPGTTVTYALTGATTGTGNNDASGTTFNVGTTTVTYTVTDASNNTATCSFTVTINPTPTANVPANATYCPGDAVPASNFTTTPAGGTFTWTNSNTAIGLAASGTGNTPGFTAANPGATPITATITVTPTLNGCVGTPVTYTITVNPTPTATVPANATYCPGDAVPASAFTTNPAGGTFTWTNSNTAIGLAASGTGNTPGFTAANPGATPIVATITVTPTLNGCVGSPVTYTITVNPTPPAPTAANASICINNTATLVATAPGGTYEWYDAPTGGNLLFTGASFTTPVLVTNTTYYVQTTVNGCVSARTPVTVTIAAGLTVNAGVDTAICLGDSYTLSVTPNGPGYSYVWDELPANMNFSNIFNPTVSPTVTTTYVATVTDINNCVGSDSVTVTVKPIPTATVPADATYCPGDNVPASTYATNPAGGTFTWTNSDPTIGLAASGTGNTPAFTATNTTNAPVVATITVTPTLNGCTGLPVTYTITVNPTPTATVPANATYCPGDPVPASAYTTNPAGGTFTWTNSDPTIGLAASGTGNTPAFNATNATNAPVVATITVTPTLNGCVGAPVTYTITVNPTPTVTVPANASYCNGDTVPASAFTTNPAGGTYTWTNSDPTIGLAASGTGNTPAFTAVNATNAPIVATITVTPTLNGCTGLPVTYTITVNPGAIATVPANITICNGGAVPASAFTSTPAGGTFTWTNSNTAIGLAASGTGNTPAFNATNSGATPITATITVIATANGCPGPPATYTITVNPDLTGTANVSICQGDSMLIGGVYQSTAGTYTDTLTTSIGCDSIVTYNLTVNIVSVAISNVTVCEGDSVLIQGNYYSTAGQYPFTFTSIDGCDSTIIYDITVAPLPTFNVTGGGSILVGESTNLTVVPGVFGSTYSWTPPLWLSCVICQSTVATPLESTWYYVTVTNDDGCSRMDSVYIEVDATTNIYVPNIFSPNNDGNNDIFLVRGKGVDEFNLMIFNRWGQMVFESTDITVGWDGTKDGKLLDQAVFVYKLHVLMHTGAQVTKTGNITLIR